jgi:diacylglycerol kinase family enzyme
LTQTTTFTAEHPRRKVRDHQFVRILLIVNTSASSVTAKGQVLIQKVLSADHDVRVAETNRRGHATQLAGLAAAGRADVVVVLGGDGTLNEAANGLVGTECALAVLPGGSTNVFARTIGMPNDPVAGVDVLLRAFDRRSIEPIGVGTANGRAFLFHAGLGYDAAIVAQVERHPRFKRWGGQALFAVAAIDTWVRHYDRRRPPFAVHLPDGTVIDDAFYTIVLNTDPYTYFGSRPFKVAPDAGLDRPLVALTIRSLGLWSLSRIVAGAMRGDGTVRSDPTVDYRPGLEGLRVVGHRPFPYQLDGDHLGETTEIVFQHRPDALRLVKP